MLCLTNIRKACTPLPMMRWPCRRRWRATNRPTLTPPSPPKYGFVGISGVFRILPNGKNEHSLDIIEISPSGDTVVDFAPKSSPPSYPKARRKTLPPFMTIIRRLIFGKDQNGRRTADFRPYARQQPLRVRYRNAGKISGISLFILIMLMRQFLLAT